MKTLRRMAVLAAGAFAIIGTSASAQATRTWVSGVGDDVNPCSRTAPCKTFAGAISKTATGGEINCLDPGGFGTINITKSLTIDCTGTTGSILGSLTTGVIVNGAGVNVILRGLSINGGNSVQGGTHGIRFLQGNSLTVEDTIIFNFTSAAASSGNGITFIPSGTAELYVHDVTISNNGGSATSAGILVAPTGGTTNATLDNVRVTNNTGLGVVVNGSSTVMLVNSDVRGNSGQGVRTSTGNPTLRVGNTSITGNAEGVSVGAGVIVSYGTNRVNGNTADGAFFGAIIPQI